MLPGYWQANAFQQRYWQDQGNYWPHWPAGPPPGGLPPGGWPLKWWWIRERDLLDDDDEVLVIL